MKNNDMVINDKYFIKMLSLIEFELKSKNIRKFVSDDAIAFLANKNLLIIDIYKIIECINDAIYKDNVKKVSIKMIKDMLNKLEFN